MVQLRVSVLLVIILGSINWDYIGIMEKKMETTIMGYNGVIQALHECLDECY